MDLIPGLGRSPRGGNGNPLQYSCLENFMDRGAWRATWSRKELDVSEHMHTLTPKCLYPNLQNHEYIIFLNKGMLQDLEKIIFHCLVRTNAIAKLLMRETGKPEFEYIRMKIDAKKRCHYIADFEDEEEAMSLEI